jgi:hypothetical protein
MNEADLADPEARREYLRRSQNKYVRTALMLVESGRCDWATAMEIAVCGLADYSDDLFAKLVECHSRSLPPPMVFVSTTLHEGSILSRLMSAGSEREPIVFRDFVLDDTDGAPR